MSFNRRTFIRSASLAAAGHVAGFRPFGVMNGLAQSSPGYKALVCLFLYGGNDSNNTIVPYDTNGYANYSSIRGPLAIAQNSLLPLTGLPNYASTSPGRRRPPTSSPTPTSNWNGRMPRRAARPPRAGPAASPT